MFAQGELIDMYKTDFLLTKEHDISLQDISEMIPFERKIYISIILEYLEKKAKLMQQKRQ